MLIFKSWNCAHLPQFGLFKTQCQCKDTLIMSSFLYLEDTYKSLSATWLRMVDVSSKTYESKLCRIIGLLDLWWLKEPFAAGLPCELVQHFSPSTPLLIGGLSNIEETKGYLQLRLKRHRWFPKVLKTRDPLTFSIGWRRFQSVPVYAIEDINGRHR